jgi:hypothetical protein
MRSSRDHAGGVPHLVRPFDPARDPGELLAYRSELRAAHDLIVMAGGGAKLPGRDSIATWGIEMKRGGLVDLREARTKSSYIEVDDHPLAEVVNQCATMERLLDVLSWAAANLRDAQVVECNPTTSWKLGGHDLVVDSRSDGLAVFEVSDVASVRNNNSKLDKDLLSLLSSAAPRRFLVTSAEWYPSLPRTRDPSLSKLQVDPMGLIESRTGLFEMVDSLDSSG